MRRLPETRRVVARAADGTPEWVPDKDASRINYAATAAVAYALGLPLALGVWAALGAAGVLAAAAQVGAFLWAVAWATRAVVGAPLAVFVVLTCIPREGECSGCGSSGFFCNRSQCGVRCGGSAGGAARPVEVSLPVALAHLLRS